MNRDFDKFEMKIIYQSKILFPKFVIGLKNNYFFTFRNQGSGCERGQGWEGIPAAFQEYSSRLFVLKEILKQGLPDNLS